MRIKVVAIPLALMLSTSMATSAKAEGTVAQSCSLLAQGFCLEGPTWRGINCLAYAMYGCATTKRDRDYCALTSKTLGPHLDADKATINKLTEECIAGKEGTLASILDSRERKAGTAGQ